MSLWSPEAHAATLSCNVTNVAWSQNDGGVQVWCSGVGYWAAGTVNIDVRKAWLSLAQAAYLSGKPLYIEYNSSGNWINYIRLGG